MFFVYILECADTSFYIGSTNNLIRRLHQHNALTSGARYTKHRRPVALVYMEEFQTLREARQREYKLKTLKRSQKEVLIAAQRNIRPALNSNRLDHAAELQVDT